MSALASEVLRSAGLAVGTAEIVRADARRLPLRASSVDLVVTSPPYFALRSYQDGGEHYAGQIGAESTPTEFVDALVEVTRECMRVLKPSGSLWVNLGDKYSDRAGPEWTGSSDRLTSRAPKPRRASSTSLAPRKSLLGIPWRYALRCVDELGLVLRAEVIWSKPNGLPESVTDRVRRNHEQWFHFTLAPRYFSAVDEIREQHAPVSVRRAAPHRSPAGRRPGEIYGAMHGQTLNLDQSLHPLGRLPGSVWSIATEPLEVPDELGVDHYAAFPTEWPRRLISGWCPREVCTACGEGRRPVTQLTGDSGRTPQGGGYYTTRAAGEKDTNLPNASLKPRVITGYACSCPDPSAPTSPGVVLDPFGGTGTTALVAKALGRRGITVDLSADYCRIAEWRTNDRDQLAKVLGIDTPPDGADDEPMFELFPDDAGGPP